MQRLPLNIKFLIPASPGFYAVSPLYDDHGVIVGASKEPIVGWATDQFNVVLPVTPDFIDEDAQAVLNPDGTVQNPTGSWESLDTWLADRKAASADGRG